jgi:hypothetical protein
MPQRLAGYTRTANFSFRAFFASRISRQAERLRNLTAIAGIQGDGKSGGGPRLHSRGVIMNCKDVTEFLSDYLDGELPLRQRVTFKLHLLLCRDCRRYLRSFATTIKLTQSLGRGPSAGEDPPVPEALVQAILAARGKDAT